MAVNFGGTQGHPLKLFWVFLFTKGHHQIQTGYSEVKNPQIIDKPAKRFEIAYRCHKMAAKRYFFFISQGNGLSKLTHWLTCLSLEIVPLQDTSLTTIAVQYYFPIYLRRAS